MKHVRQALALMLAMFVSLVIATPAFAVDYVKDTQAGGTAKIKITNAEETEYTLTKIFDSTVSANGDINYKITKAQLDELDKPANAAAKTFFTDNFTTRPVDTQDASKGMWVSEGSTLEAEVKNAKDNSDFAAFVAAIGTQVATIDNTKAGTEGKGADTVTFDKIPFGWYYIDETANGSFVTVDSTTPNAEVQDKNSIVEINKEIKYGGKVSSDGKTNAAGLDEPTQFEVTANTKNYDQGEKVYEYKITDTMAAGFSILADDTTDPQNIVKNFEVTIGGQPGIPVTTFTPGTKYEYKVTFTGGQQEGASGFEIIVPWTTTGDKTGAPLYDTNDVIVVTYTAKLDSNKVNDVNLTGANLNEVEIKNKKGDQTDYPTGDGPKSRTRTFDTGIKLFKVDENNQPMAGAEFELTKKDANGDYGPNNVVAVMKVSGGSGTTSYDPWPLNPTGQEDGPYWKLKDGTYSDEDPMEFAADGVTPKYDLTKYDNYDPSEEANIPNWTDWASASDPERQQIMQAQNIMQWPKFEKVTGSGAGTVTVDTVKGANSTPATRITAVTGSDGYAYFYGLAEGDYKLEEITVPAGYVKYADILFNIAFDAGTYDAANDTYTTKPSFAGTVTAPSGLSNMTWKQYTGDDLTNGVLELTIKNEPGTEFPETGGMGTRILYTVGGLMVAGAAIYLITKKRMASEA